MLRLTPWFMVVSLLYFGCAVKTAPTGTEKNTQSTETNFDELWDYDNPEETESKFRALLPEAIKSGDAAYRAELLSQIARTQGLQGRFDKAHKTLDEAEGLISGAHAKARVRITLERGRVYNSSGDKTKAGPLFDSAYKLAKENRLDFYAVDAAHMLGIVEPFDKALKWNHEALAIAEQSKDERARNWKGSLYNNIGWAYFDKKEYEKALDMFDKALQFRTQQGKNKEIRIARWCVARVQRQLGRLPEALATQQSLEDEMHKLGEKGGYVYEELAECYLAMNEAEKATKYFALAYAELSKDRWLTKNRPERIERLKKLGSVK